jgi:hypothetical protein
MHPFRWPAALLFLTSCTEVGGTWIGSCGFSDARYGYTAAVELNIADGSGSIVQGKMILDMFDGTTFEGNVTGLRSDTYIELEAPIRREDGQYEIFLNGDIDENVIEGECRIRIPNGAGALVGNLILER